MIFRFKNPIQGASFIEVIVMVAIVTIVGVGGARAYMQRNVFQKRIENHAAEEDIKTFLRKFVDCEQTLSFQGSLCTTAGTNYVELRDSDGNKVVDSWPKQTLFGNSHLVRARCKTIGTNQQAIEVEAAKINPHTSGVQGEYTHSASGTVGGTPSFSNLFNRIPLVCAYQPAAACSNSAAIVTETITVNVPKTPSTVTCSGGSSSSTRVFDQKYEQEFVISIPSYTESCGMKINIPTVSFEYDDEFALTFDDVILASSYYPRPASATQPIKFSWPYVQGLYYKWDDPGSITHCTAPKIGDRIFLPLKCAMPTGKGATVVKKGKLDVQLDKEVADFVLNSIRSNTVHKVKMIMFGNGVTVPPGDCYHTAFTFSIELKYIP